MSGSVLFCFYFVFVFVFVVCLFLFFGVKGFLSFLPVFEEIIAYRTRHHSMLSYYVVCKL